MGQVPLTSAEVHRRINRSEKSMPPALWHTHLPQWRPSWCLLKSCRQPSRSHSLAPLITTQVTAAKLEGHSRTINISHASPVRPNVWEIYIPLAAIRGDSIVQSRQHHMWGTGWQWQVGTINVLLRDGAGARFGTQRDASEFLGRGGGREGLGSSAADL